MSGDGVSYTIQLSEQDVIDTTAVLSRVAHTTIREDGIEIALRRLLATQAAVNNVLANLCGVDETIALLRRLIVELETATADLQLEVTPHGHSVMRRQKH